LESLAKSIDEMNSSMEVSCGYLLGKLKGLFELSLDKTTKKQTPSARKIQWARISIQSASVMASILKNVELEELRDEIEALKG
jgi:hypothetical protein